jgi:hypothetical protein
MKESFFMTLPLHHEFAGDLLVGGCDPEEVHAVWQGLSAAIASVKRQRLPASWPC